MAETVQGMIFQVDVDTTSATAKLKSFTATATTATGKAKVGADRASKSYDRFEREIAGVAGAQNQGAVAAGKQSAAQQDATQKIQKGATAAGRGTVAEQKLAGGKAAAGAAATGASAAESANTTAKVANARAAKVAATANTFLSTSLTGVTGSSIAATTGVNALTVALAGTAGAAGAATSALGPLLVIILPIVATIAGFILLAKAVGFLSDQYGEAVGAAAEYEVQVRRLAVALSNAGENTIEARRELLEYAEALTLASVATEEQIIGAQAMAISLGASVQTANDLALAATNLAAATGVELETAIRQLGRTLGGLGGELGEAIFQVKDLTAEQLRQGGAVDLVNRLFADFGVKMSTTYAGAVNNVASTFKKLRQEVGAAGREIAKVFLQEVITPFIADMAEAAEAGKALQNVILSIGLVFAEAALAASFLGPALKKTLLIAIPQLRQAARLAGALAKGLLAVSSAAAAMAKNMDPDNLTPFQQRMLAAIERLEELKITGIDATEGIGEGFDRMQDKIDLAGFQGILDQVKEIRQVAEDFKEFTDTLADTDLSNLGGDLTRATLTAKAWTKLNEAGKAFVEGGIPQQIVERILGINLSLGPLRGELVGLAADLINIQQDAANFSESVLFLDNQLAAGLVTPEAYREAMAALAEGILELAAIGGEGTFDEILEQWAWTAVVEARLESLSSKMDFFNAQYIEAGSAALGFSQIWATKMGETFAVVDRAANALQSVLGKQNKFVKGLRKIEAASMIIAGIGSIRKGAIRFAKGLPFDFLEQGAGLAMIAEGVAAIAAARKLGGGGGGEDAGASAGAGGGGGGGGGFATPVSPDAPPSEAPPGFQQDITVFIDGQGVVQDIESFARQVADEIAAQGSRSGRTFEN